MSHPPPEPATSACVSPASPKATWRIGCVSYLNARPLIDGLDAPASDNDGTDHADAQHVRYDVPARLLSDLEAGNVDVALCPVIDYHRSRAPLVIVPAGGIGCAGATLTVRLFSRVPIERVRCVHVDAESHTSVALLRVILAERFGSYPELVTYDARAGDAPAGEWPETTLLIGDKVVTDSPDERCHPHQLDLGEAWRTLTGLPFVFAVWMARRDTDLGELPRTLDRQRRINAERIDHIVKRDAERHGWPPELARHYLAEVLRYAVGERELEAIDRFGKLAAVHGMIDAARPLEVHPLPSANATE